MGNNAGLQDRPLVWRPCCQFALRGKRTDDWIRLDQGERRPLDIALEVPQTSIAGRNLTRTRFVPAADSYARLLYWREAQRPCSTQASSLGGEAPQQTASTIVARLHGRLDGRPVFSRFLSRLVSYPCTVHIYSVQNTMLQHSNTFLQWYYNDMILCMRCYDFTALH